MIISSAAPKPLGANYNQIWIFFFVNHQLSNNFISESSLLDVASTPYRILTFSGVFWNFAKFSFLDFIKINPQNNRRILLPCEDIQINLQQNLQQH